MANTSKFDCVKMELTENEKEELKKIIYTIIDKNDKDTACDKIGSLKSWMFVSVQGFIEDIIIEV